MIHAVPQQLAFHFRSRVFSCPLYIPLVSTWIPPNSSAADLGGWFFLRGQSKATSYCYRSHLKKRKEQEANGQETLLSKSQKKKKTVTNSQKPAPLWCLPPLICNGGMCIIQCFFVCSHNLARASYLLGPLML